MNTPTKEFACDLIWSDPTNLYEGWTENDRGVSISFGGDVVTNFLKNHDISLICRGHEIPYNGFQFFADKKLVTICSLAKYCDIYNNTSAVMMVDDKSNVLFKSIYYRNEYINKEYEE
jgi:serine/threonine-protein phosphatase PP1 catalytic subunit